MRTLIGLCALLIALPVEARQCEFVISTTQPVLMADQRQTTAIKIAVRGFEMQSEQERAPLNIALVIDRSGSMAGQRIEQAREAAIQAIRRMDSRDIVSVVTFDNNVDVLIPATRVSDRENMERRIRAIQPGGTTAIYAGVQRGAEEVRKFFERGMVNRIILLSDGLANVGPSTPEELARLGRALGGEGITVTTLGLGRDYNEDLMSRLAAASDGNHKFVANASELPEIFQQEFNTALAVVAQDVRCVVTLPEGIRPVRALNMEVDINGQEVTFGWNQIYSGHERFVMLEVEVPATAEGQTRELATATLRYTNMETRNVDNLSARLNVRFSSSAAQVRESINRPVMEDYVELLGNLENRRAMELRDRGDIEGARRAFLSNSVFLEENARALGGSARLGAGAAMNTRNADEAASPDSIWRGGARMQIIERQHQLGTQQSF